MTLSFDSKAYRKDLEETAAALQRHFGAAPDFAVVFGSGLGRTLGEAFPQASRRQFSEIPHLMSPLVEGHQGCVWKAQGKKVGSSSAVIFQGRIHYYEGFPVERVVLPVRAMALWGVKRLFLTNAAGSIREAIRPGRLARIGDHLNLTGVNPLRGPNLDFLGTRFPSLENAYQNDFSRSVDKVARRLKIHLPRAVYVGIAGPSYETDAEIRAFRILGGDLVGMSTVLETIAATHAGLQVTALSAVTNSCLKRKQPLNHEEVLENAKAVDQLLAKLLLAMLEVGKGAK